MGTDALRDSSLAAIAVCGLLELVKHLPVTDPTVSAIWHGRRDYVLPDEALSDGQRGEGQRPVEALEAHHLASNKGVDECASWGDYFYVEALVRFTQSWKLYW